MMEDLSEEQMRQLFRTYMEAMNNHRTEEVLSCFSGDFQLHFTGSDFVIDREGMRDVLAWDAGVNGTVSCASYTVRADSIIGLFIEKNDFFRLLGIEEFRSKNAFTYDDSGKIKKQVYTEIPGQPSFVERMQPAVDWARKHQAEELKEIYPKGQMEFSREMGRRWVHLLEQWRDLH